MKHAIPHQGLLESALQTYLSTAQPLLRQQALEEAQRHLINPSMLLDAPQLTARHPLRAQALIIADAFEAVTNGMATAEVMEPLQTLAEDSLFGPWKHLTLAVHFFYEGLDEATTAHLARIPPSSPLVPLARTLTRICTAEGSQVLDGPARRLFIQLHATNQELASMAQQLTDALESHAENAFWSVLADLLEECAVQHETLARRITLWVWNQLAWLEFDEANLLDMTQALWGRAEASRLAALGSLSWDPEGAALLWGRFLVQALREDDLTDEEREKGWELLQEFHACALEATDQRPDALWQATWVALSQGWRSELRLRGLAEADFPHTVTTTPIPSPSLNRTLAPSAAAQLDLFAS